MLRQKLETATVELETATVELETATVELETATVEKFSLQEMLGSYAQQVKIWSNGYVRPDHVCGQKAYSKPHSHQTPNFFLHFPYNSIGHSTNLIPYFKFP